MNYEEICIGDISEFTAENLSKLEGKIIDRVEPSSECDPGFIYFYENLITPEHQRDLIRGMYEAVLTGDYRTHLAEVTNNVLRTLLNISNGDGA